MDELLKNLSKEERKALLAYLATQETKDTVKTKYGMDECWRDMKKTGVVTVTCLFTLLLCLGSSE